MLRLALIGGPDDAAGVARIASRVRGARFSAVVNRDERSAQLSANALGAEVCTTDVRRLFGEHSQAFEAAIICGPGQQNVAICQSAIRSSKHLLLESPFTLSESDLASIVTASAEAGVRLMIGQTLRFLPSVQAVKQSRDAGQLGEPALLRIHRWESRDSSHCQADATEESESTLLPILGRLAGEIDAAYWFFSETPTHVFAVGRRSASDQNGLEYLQLHLGFAGDGMVLIDHARTLPPGECYFSLSLIGAKGAAYADDHHDMQLLFGEDHPRAIKTPQGDLHVLLQLQEFVAAIAENREPAVTGADARRVIQVIEAAAESLASRRARCLIQR
jgi:predicted dehydrogenase